MIFKIRYSRGGGPFGLCYETARFHYSKKKKTDTSKMGESKETA